MRSASGPNVPATAIVAAGILAAAMLIALPLTLPISVSYSDIYMYFDAAYRMQHGQQPHLDFILPTNSLPFTSFALVTDLFPKAQPVIATQAPYLFLLAPAYIAVALYAKRPTAI
jgi:hypothetical protein